MIMFVVSLLALLLQFNVLLPASTSAAEPAADSEFVSVNDGHFQWRDKPYYFVGANYWYGGILASKGEGGNRERLAKELDFLKAAGVDNLRILAGAEGPNDQPYRVSPGLQQAPGKYNEELLDGLDYLMAELGKREMKAVLYLHNTWEWTGGYSQYLNWNGYGDIPYPLQKSWPEFMKYAAQFHTCEKCQQQYYDHIRFMLSRTNAYTGKTYIDDPTLMSWQLANEPRALAREHIPAFEKWTRKATALIRELDGRHLISTGNEGEQGCEGDFSLYERMHADPNVDYLTIHIWPKNWQWIDPKNVPSKIDEAISKTNDYVEKHTELARKLKKPIVIEEFGFPRDDHSYTTAAPTSARDKYYGNLFQHVVDSAKKGDALAGVNFWTFGGSGRPAKREGDVFWHKGDDLIGDPPQEEQGLNSVFDVDTTMKVVEKYAKELEPAASK